MEHLKSGSGSICSYKGCKNSYYKTSGVKYFTFPKDPTIDHFSPEMFTFDKKRLLHGAVPKHIEECAPLESSLSEPEAGPSTSSGIQSFSCKRKLSLSEEDISKKRHIAKDDQPQSIDIVSETEPVEEKTSLASVQTPLSLTSHTPRKQKYRKKIADLEKEVLDLKNDIKSLECKQNTPVTAEEFETLCDRFLPEFLSSFVKVQLQQIKRAPHGRRYSDEFKEFALSLYFLGPKCYKHLQKSFLLPSPRSLQRFTEKFYFTAGINKNLFNLLKLKLTLMDEEDKTCVICVDEMSIKCNLFYNYGRDEIIGFEDNGMSKKFAPASLATVIMARGLKSNWKQPLGYLFSESGTSCSDLRIILEEFVLNMDLVGLKPVALITDMGSNFIELTNSMGVTPDNPIVTLANKELVFIFDPPHLLKAVRNNLMRNEFRWDDNKTSWSHIVTFYELDKRFENRIAPHLTEACIRPNNFDKMRVTYAAKILSARVAAGLETYIELKILPQEAHATKDFISKFDKLFDIFNSSKFNEPIKDFKTPYSGQITKTKFLNEMLTFLNKLKVFNRKGKNISNYIKSITCWKISIKGLILLYEKIKSQTFVAILTRRLNQDALENFFGYVRKEGGNCVNPTPTQFCRAFKKSFITNYFHSQGMNCAEDMDQLLVTFCNYKEQPHSAMNTSPNDEAPTPFRIQTVDYREQELPEQNAFKYVCGYLVKKCLQQHSCLSCQSFAKQNEELDDSNLFLHFAAYNTNYNIFGSLKTPHESFYNYIYLLETNFLANFANYATKSAVGNSLFGILSNVGNFSHPCKNFPMHYLLKLFIRLRIYYALRYSNRDFKSQPKKHRKLCILMNL